MTAALSVPGPRCSIDGCEKRAAARGWCGMHYQRWYKHGNLHHVPFSVYPTIHDQFARSVRPFVLGCWIWTAGVGNHGYGRLRKRVGDNTIEILAHRYSYERFVGPIPDGLTIDHLCRVRRCVNPMHLEPVTRAENTLREWEALRAAAA